MANNTMPKAEQISFVPSGTVTSGDVQRAIEELNGQIGGAVGKYIPFDVSTTPYQAVSFSVLSVDATASDIVILAPTSPQPGDLLIVRKMDATENLVIFSGPLINGAPSLILQTQFATAELVFDGSNWGATSATAADQIPIADPEGLFTGTNVEAALTELGEQVLRAVTQEVYIASEGQTYVNLMNKYQPGINNLQVYINGLKQTVGSDYTETSNDQIQFLEGLHGGDKITLLVGFIPNNSGPVPSLSFLDETKSLTAGQTVITINTQYFVGINNIAVFLNGVRLVNGLDYIESSSTTITLQEAASAGDILYVQIGQFTVTGDPSTSDQIQHTPNSPEPVTNVRDELNQLAARQVRYLANRPAAEALATAMPDGATIWIDSDEADGGVRTRNTVAGGVLTSPVADAAAGVQFTQAGTGAAPRSVAAKLGEFVSVEDFGAIGDGVADDTDAIKTALDYLGSIGGGKLLFPAGIYLVSESTGESLANWDGRAAIYIKAPKIHLQGAGIGSTKIRLANGANAHVVKFGTRSGTPIIPDDCSISDIEIDGNRANQALPTTTLYHWNGVDVASGASRVHICRMNIHDIQYYGIGFQRRAFRGCAVENVDIYSVGADGIDWKDDDGLNSGNRIRGVSVKNFGLASGLDPLAGVDIRGGIRASDITVTTLSGDKVGIRLNESANSANPEVSRLSNFYVSADSLGTNTFGVAINSNQYSDISISNGKVVGAKTGVLAFYKRAQISNVMTTGCDIGFHVWDQTKLMGCIADSGVYSGFRLRGPGVSMVGCQSTNNVLGVQTDAGANNCEIIGGEISGNGTALLDNGTGTIIRDVAGYKTRSTVAASFSVTAAATVSLTIPHGLSATPSTSGVSLSLVRETNVSDYSIGFLRIYNTDSTNVYVEVRVLAPSATGGATAKVVATCTAKHQT